MLRAALPAGREARLLLLGTLFSSLGQGLTLPFLLVYLTQLRGLSAGTVGVLVSVTGVVGLIVTPLGGTLVDRFGGRRVVLPLYLLVSLGTVALAFVDSTATAMVALVAVAGLAAPLWSASGTILAALVPDDERQKVFGLNFTLINLGIGAGGLLAGSFVDTTRLTTFQVLYVGDALSYLVPFTILLTLRHVGRSLAATRAATEAGPPAPSGGYLRVFGDARFRVYFVFALVLATVGYAQIEVGFTGFALTEAHVSARVIGWAFAGNTLLIVVAQLFVLRFLEGRSRSRALALVGLIFALSWTVLALSGIAGSSGYAVLAAVGVISCSTIFASGETMMSPVLPAIVNALAPDELRGRYNAVGSMAWGLSGVIGPLTAGPLIGAGHAGIWVGAIIAGSLVATVLALRLHRVLTPEQDGRARPAAPDPGERAAAPDPGEHSAADPAEVAPSSGEPVTTR